MDASGVLTTLSLGVYGLDHFRIVLKVCTRMLHRKVTGMGGRNIRIGVYVELIVMDFINGRKKSLREAAVLSLQLCVLNRKLNRGITSLLSMQTASSCDT